MPGQNPQPRNGPGAILIVTATATSRTEVVYENKGSNVLSLGVVNSLALLKLWAEDTPRAIFPQRRVGFLRDGNEANFLALEGNPLEDWRNVRRKSC